eukprot:1921202-Amphidinium_carterae.1
MLLAQNRIKGRTLLRWQKRGTMMTSNCRALALFVASYNPKHFHSLWGQSTHTKCMSMIVCVDLGQLPGSHSAKTDGTNE